MASVARTAALVAIALLTSPWIGSSTDPGGVGSADDACSLLWATPAPDPDPCFVPEGFTETVGGRGLEINTLRSLPKFLEQVQRWGYQPGEAIPISYDKAGNVYWGFPPFEYAPRYQCRYLCFRRIPFADENCPRAGISARVR